MLRLEGAAKRYGDNTVYEGLDFEVERSERVALVGASGSGTETGGGVSGAGAAVGSASGGGSASRVLLLRTALVGAGALADADALPWESDEAVARHVSPHVAACAPWRASTAPSA